MKVQVELHGWLDQHVHAGVQHGWVAELHHRGLLLPGSSSPLPQLPQAHTAHLEARSILWGQVGVCSLAILVVSERCVNNACHCPADSACICTRQLAQQACTALLGRQEQQLATVAHAATADWAPHGFALQAGQLLPGWLARIGTGRGLHAAQRAARRGPYQIWFPHRVFRHSAGGWHSLHLTR